MAFSDWSYYRKITLGGATGAGTNYQKLVRVGESSGSSNYDVHLGGHCTDFPNDIRFYDNDQSTELDHWLERITGSGSNRTAYFWVEVKDDLGSDVDIYINYGKSGAGSASNGDNTFLFFCDGTGTLSDKWTVLSGTWAYDNGELKHTGAGADRLIKAKFTPPNDCAVHWKAKETSLTWPSVIGVVVRTNDTMTAGYLPGMRPNDAASDRRWGIEYYAASAWERLAGISYTYSTNTYYNFDFEIAGSAMKAHLNGANELTASNSTYTSGSIIIRANNPSGSYSYIDDFFVRKYVSPEPTIKEVGAEQIIEHATGAMLLLLLN